ncbi:hypothetical protein [Salinimicrobium sediminilitoris]|uniref:hypothetical protein n=1 Tax=Salinimicrobium sediminilitoris TaxID=2876715 RepID=UPI001E329DDD|nr:hypothetical protein [Salinimicrobium sediminilitoris]MCC8359140.1 hypothetical protein [Salinimicrobium sediminilitoris]
MKGKIHELEDIRAKVEKLKVKNDGFVEELMQLLNKTTSQLSKIDDQQEINWTSKSFDIATDLKNGETNKNSEEQKDLALTYLKEALDSVIIREKGYLE